MFHTFIVQLVICGVGKTSVEKSLIFEASYHQKAEDADPRKRGSGASADSLLIVNEVAMEEHRADARCGYSLLTCLTHFSSYMSLQVATMRPLKNTPRRRAGLPQVGRGGRVVVRLQERQAGLQ